MVYRERDNFESELKGLTKSFETLDLAHTALTRDRNTLSKEVKHTHTNTLLLSVLLCNNVIKMYFFFCPPGGDFAAVSDSAAEGQGVPAQAEHGA